jgi:hypothetical protein
MDLGSSGITLAEGLNMHHATNISRKEKAPLILAPAFKAVGESGFDLMRKQFPPLRFLVHGLMPEGTILIAGKPKSGKSWLVLNVMLASTLGASFLDRSVKQGKALYLALEDNPRRMQSRLTILMRKHQDEIEALRRFEYRTEWPAGADGAAALDQYLTAHPEVRTVAVDVLKRIRPAADFRRSGYEQDYEAIQPWKAVADKHRITLLIVHHTRKAGADDVFDEVSGTLGLTGAVDQLLVLRRIPHDPKAATLHARGRDLPEDHELGIELRDGWWELVGDAKVIEANDARKLVLEVLEEADHPLTIPEIMKATNKRSRPSTSRLLSKMVRDQLIVKDGKGFRPAPTSVKPASAEPMVDTQDKGDTGDKGDTEDTARATHVSRVSHVSRSAMSVGTNASKRIRQSTRNKEAATAVKETVNG